MESKVGCGKNRLGFVASKSGGIIEEIIKEKKWQILTKF